MATLLKTNGETSEVKPQSGKKDFTLEELQGFVGGIIEVIRIPGSKRLLIVNQEGVMAGLPFNRAASLKVGMTIVGDAAVLEPGEIR